MKRTLAFAAALTVGMVSSLAVAAPRPTYKWSDPALKGTSWKQPVAGAVSNVIYLNNCKPGGCSIKAGGYDDSTTNLSEIARFNTVVPAYKGTDAQWNAIVQCVKQTYADFDVQIVTTRPSGSTYHMAVVAGIPQDIGEDEGAAGVSMFGCSYMPHAISYAFANLDPSNVADICWTISQETAHSWGLDHKFDDRDPMTYLYTGPTYKRFQNEAGSCGEYGARPCDCSYAGTGSTKMNSFALIKSLFGSSAPDVVPPTVSFTSPSEGAQVEPGFVVRAAITDDRTVVKAELRMDGMLVNTLTDQDSWIFATPQTLSQGGHKLEITAYDRAGNTTKATVNVSFGTVCASDADCTNGGEVCLDSHCVVGPGANNGLGADCASNNDCASGQCAADTEGHSYCVEACDPAASTCPGGFSCLDTGTSGVCWPADGGGGGGCNTGRDNGTGILVLALSLVGLVMLRRTRR